MADISKLIAALSSSNAEKRVAAAEGLAELGADAHPAALALVRASSDANEEVREAAVAALEELGPPALADLPTLMTFFHAPELDRAYWAITLVGRLGQEAGEAVGGLIEALSPSHELTVRQRAAWALGEIGPAASAARRSLTQAAQTGDPRLARLAQDAIDQIDG